ncbi:MAG: hypothetical protein KBF07_00260 [Pseudomonas sp.]|nr:hypothetical protein [Pseudomonas sp.]
MLEEVSMLTEIDCGMTRDHINVFQSLAREYSTFIFVRPVNQDSTSLIAEGYSTKKLDIHAKSSNWGPMSGFICVDSELSKVVDEGPDKVAKNREAVRHALRTDGVGQTELIIPYTRIEELVKKGLFTHAGMGGSFQASSRKNVKQMRFECERSADGRCHVYYYPAGKKMPVMVIGYKHEGAVIAVTADYDIFAICPHHTAPGFSSASVANVTDQGLLGVLSRFQENLIRVINSRCGKHPVVNHGTELNNPFPENDRELAMFVPGGNARMINRGHLHDIFGDLAIRGFHVYSNSRWNAAVRTHIGSRMSRLQNPAVRGACATKYLSDADFNGLSVRGYGGETRLAFAQDKFGKELVNNSAADIRPRWRF